MLRKSWSKAGFLFIYVVFVVESQSWRLWLRNWQTSMMMVDKGCWVSHLEQGTTKRAKRFHGWVDDGCPTAAHLACVASGSDEVPLNQSEMDNGTGSEESCWCMWSDTLVTLLCLVPLLIPQITQASTIAPRGKWNHRTSLKKALLLTEWEGNQVNKLLYHQDDKRKTKQGCLGLGEAGHGELVFNLQSMQV